MNTITFPHNETACTINISVQYSQNDIDNIVVGAIEGAISYWGYVKGVYGVKPEEYSLAQWCTKVLLDGKSVTIGVREDDEEHYELTLSKVAKGIEKHHTNKLYADKEDYDAEDYDCIMQYALFSKLVYG